MILLIDTASSNRVVSVFDHEKEVITKIEKNDLTLSSRMLPMIEETLEEAHVTPDDIDTLLVVTGPGSFTGIRVGVTIAKTWAWAFHKKIIPVSELEFMATTKFEGDYIVPYIDARREYGYAAIYDQFGNVILEDSHILKDELLSKIPSDKKVVFTSFDEVDVPYSVIKPNVDVAEFVKRHAMDEGVNPHECNPNYLKKTEAEENLEKGILNDSKNKKS